MMRMLSIVTLCCILAACHRLKGSESELSQDFPGLASVHLIHISDLNQIPDRTQERRGYGSFLNPELVSVFLKKQIRMELARSGRFVVVEAAQQADAILAGAAGIEGVGLYVGYGALRLIESKTMQTIWTYEYTRRFSGRAQFVFEDVAHDVADTLLRDAIRADSKKLQNQQSKPDPAEIKP